MRVLVIDPCKDGGAGALDFAWRASECGHKVKFFQAKTPHNEFVGAGLVDRIDDFNKWVLWADLILNVDNTRYLDIMARARAEGQSVISATKESASWEIEREKGMGVLKKHGIPTADHRVFTNYDEAIAYVKQTMKRLVSKPVGDGDADRSLSYCAKSPADMVFMLERWKRMKHKSRFMLQDFKVGTEMAVGVFVGPNGYASNYCENFEFKKLMVGDIGIATGEMGCYSDDTEVLTSDGWKYWEDVTTEDELATIVGKEFVFERPTEVVSYDIDDELIGWKSPTVDVLVTKNHNMYVQDTHSRNEFSFEAAESIEGEKRLVLRGGIPWLGNDTGITREFAALVGAYIADGSLKKRSIVFGNCPPHKQEKFTEIARMAGYEAKMYGPDLYINSKQLVEEFSIYGKSYEKFVHQKIKDSTTEVIESFIEGYLAGDGSNHKSGSVYAETVSKRLADDLQELSLKLGMPCSISTRDRAPSHLINGVMAKSYRISYSLCFCQRVKKATVSPDCVYRVPYKGKVYCATVSSHVLMVRRNGKPLWCGNTVMKFTDKSKLADKVLKKVEKAVVETGHIGYIDVNCIIDDHGDVWPLEWTSRLGWPTFNIQANLFSEDPVEWLKCLADGDKVEPFKTDEVAVGAVVAIPDFPYSTYTAKETAGIPIYGLTPALLEHFHICSVMRGPAPIQVGDEIVEQPHMLAAGDYIGVMVGTGTTITKARSRLYARIDQLEIPNSPMYRTDIGVRLKNQLPNIQSHGFATGIRYNGN